MSKSFTFPRLFCTCLKIPCKYSLIDIANIINNLNNYTVDVDLQNQKNAPDYIGHYYNVNIQYDGFEHGIAETYRKIKNEKNMVCPK